MLFIPSVFYNIKYYLDIRWPSRRNCHSTINFICNGKRLKKKYFFYNILKPKRIKKKPIVLKYLCENYSYLLKTFSMVHRYGSKTGGPSGGNARGTRWTPQRLRLWTLRTGSERNSTASCNHSLTQTRCTVQLTRRTTIGQPRWEFYNPFLYSNRSKYF